METVVNKQLQNSLLKNELISSKQFGFRPDHGTADLLHILAHTWNASLDRNKEVCIVPATSKVLLTKCVSIVFVLNWGLKESLACFSNG